MIGTGSLTNPLAGFCNRCEHSYQLTVGAPSTTTTGAPNVQGATALTVAPGGILHGRSARRGRFGVRQRRRRGRDGQLSWLIDLDPDRQ
jgi:hypothetical protein